MRDMEGGARTNKSFYANKTLKLRLNVAQEKKYAASLLSLSPPQAVFPVIRWPRTAADPLQSQPDPPLLQEPVLTEQKKTHPKTA